MWNAHGRVSDLLFQSLKRVKFSILPLVAVPCSPRSGRRSEVTREGPVSCCAALAKDKQLLEGAAHVVWGELSQLMIYI